MEIILFLPFRSVCLLYLALLHMQGPTITFNRSGESRYPCLVPDLHSGRLDAFALSVMVAADVFGMQS